MQRIPYMVVLGDREMQEKQVTVRTQSGEDLGAMAIEAFIQHLNSDIEKKV